MPKNHPTRLKLEELLNSCAIKRTRGSGPGGQHRNKVETAIVITHSPTGIIGQASEKRSQKQNMDVATERLRLNLAIAVRSEINPQTEPSEIWQGRVQAKKISVSPNHFDYSTLIAEALDFVTFEDFDVAAAAKRLEITTSQLVKLLKTCQAAFELVNRKRVARDLHRMN